MLSAECFYAARLISSIFIWVRSLIPEAHGCAGHDVIEVLPAQAEQRGGVGIRGDDIR